MLTNEKLEVINEILSWEWAEPHAFAQLELAGENNEYVVLKMKYSVPEIHFSRKIETKLSNRNFRKDLAELIHLSTNDLIRKDFLGKGFECNGPFMHIVNYYVEDATNQFDVILLNLYEDCNLKNIF